MVDDSALDHSAVARKSVSFDLVEKEMNTTIARAEASLEQFQDSRGAGEDSQSSGEDLQNCVGFLKQLRGIFTLIEFQGGTILCEEITAIVNELPERTAEDKNTLLTSLSQALFILRRYTEYYDRRREDHPELLLEVINQLRSLRQAKPLPDGYFFEANIRLAEPFSADDLQIDADVFQFRSRRLRHMFQVGLLNLLRRDEQDVAFKLLARATSGLGKLSKGSSLARAWLLSSKASELMFKHTMRVSISRQRLYMRLEKYAKAMAKSGKAAVFDTSVSSTVIRELLHIIAVSGDREPDTLSLLADFDSEPADFDETRFATHLSLLMGPGRDVLMSLAQALHEEVNQIKDKLDIIERGIDSDEDSFEHMSRSLARLADTLLMLDLHKLSAVARHLQTKLRGWSLDRRKPADCDLLSIADSVLNIEQAVYKLEEEGLTVETDKLAGRKARLEQSPYLSEAMIVVLGESQNSIALAKRSITAYLESEGDRLHLNNIMAGLEAVTGALQMIGQSRAGAALQATARYIQERLILADAEPDEHSLDTLADALTSLEYYADSLNRSITGNAELLVLAEESVQSLGY